MKPTLKHNPTAHNGYTLIELLVVISIIGLLSSIALVAFNGARRKAQEARWKADLAQIQKAYEFYFNDKSRYPFSNNGFIPVDQLAPYTKSPALITAIRTGAGSYYAASRNKSDPDFYILSDDASHCLRIHQGYIIAIGNGVPNQDTLNDGGMEPAYYEKIYGDFKIYDGGHPNAYSSSSYCPDY